MKKFKTLAIIFAAAAFLLSNTMCAVVAYNWCRLEYAIKYEGYSAPADIALLAAIPFLLVIIICIVLTVVFMKKSK